MGAQSRPVILLTRPRPAAEAFARSLRRAFRANGHPAPSGGDAAGLAPHARPRIMIAPLMAPHPVQPAPGTVPPWLAEGQAPLAHPGQPDPARVVFTSQEGVRAFVRLWPVAGWHALCVGARTASLARRAGFRAEAVAGGTAQALLAHLTAEAATSPPQWPILIVRGRETALDLAAALAQRGYAASSVIVYAQEAVPLAPRAVRLLQGRAPVILPVFSARSAALLAAAAQGVRAPLKIAAISQSVARAAAALHPCECVLAATPDAAGMRAAVTQLVSGGQNIS